MELYNPYQEVQKVNLKHINFDLYDTKVYFMACVLYIFVFTRFLTVITIE